MEINFPFEDITFEYSQKDFEKNELRLIDDGIFVSQNEFQLDMEEIGVFRVTNGTHIELFPYATTIDESLLEQYIHGPVLGALLHQRKILPLHASAVSYQGKGILFCGDSGAGKSTSALAFSEAGARILTDDISPVLHVGERNMILGYSPRLKLCEDVFETLNMNEKRRERIWTDDEREKYYYPFQVNKIEQQVNYVFFFKIGKQLKQKKLKGVEKFTKLYQQIFRNEYLIEMPDTQKAYYSQIHRICQSTEMFEIGRPETIHPLEFRNFLLTFIHV